MMIGKPLGTNGYGTGLGIGINSAQPSRIQYGGNASFGSRTFGTGLTTRAVQGLRDINITNQQDARNAEILNYLSSLEDGQPNEIIPEKKEDVRVPEILKGKELSLKLQKFTKQIAKQKGVLKDKQKELSKLAEQEQELKEKNKHQENIIKQIVSKREKIESAIEKLNEKKENLEKEKDEIKSTTRQVEECHRKAKLLMESQNRKIDERIKELKRDNSSDSKESEGKSDSNSDRSKSEDEPKEIKETKIEAEWTHKKSKNSHPKKKGKRGKK